MALRNQPYLPLYVQDFMTDEKLAECSAQATGVYVRLLCLMHKSDEYGKILLKQKDKQTDEQIKNFAAKISKQMPYTEYVIAHCLTELLDEKVLQIDGDYLIQRRMVRDNELSEIRSVSGKKGVEKKNKNFAIPKPKAKSKAKQQANADIEIDTEITDEKYKGYGFSNSFIEVLDKWFKYRIEIKKPYKSETAISEFLQTAKELGEVEFTKRAKHSMSNQYQGLVDRKDSGKKEAYIQPEDKQY